MREIERKTERDFMFKSHESQKNILSSKYDIYFSKEKAKQTVDILTW